MTQNISVTRKKIKISTIVLYILVSLFALFCLYPFLLVISSSFTEEVSLVKYGYRLIPKAFTLEAYKAYSIR